MGTLENNRDGKTQRWMNLLENLFVVILVFYPLRHIGCGLDFRDTGYNYANFQYMGTEHMDPMWLFSTYLANAAGNFLMKLPKADTMMGMNMYTGLLVSVLSLTGYFFCTRKIKMPRGLVFLGEMMAISLCWCPTAVLYNYLTYLLFLGSFLLLYHGLLMESGPVMGEGYSEELGLFVWKRHRKKQGRMLAGAGVLLGTNVLVRFSNLPEAAMIVAVWAYNVILWLEERSGKERTSTKESNFWNKEGFWHRLGRHTLWCFVGYGAALIVLLGYIHLRYGIGEYVTGIRRLFAMTENAADYKASSMIMGLAGDYVENLYWVVRIGIIAAGGLGLFFVAGKLEKKLCGLCGEKGAKVFHIGIRAVWAAVCAAMLAWLYGRKFCSLLFYSYDPIRRPCILFLMLTMLIGVIRIFHKDSPKEEKLLSGMLILVILLTSIGSNNRTFPSWNNLFVAAPYTFWQCWRFVSGRKKICLTKSQLRLEGGSIHGTRGNEAGRKGILFPVKAVLLTFLGMCMFQAVGFGAVFVFAESTGVQDATAYVENNKVLANIKMPAERAAWLAELTDCVEQEGLSGREVILYGNIPSLSYYLQMPSAFNPWSDLLSYSLETMEKDMAELELEMAEKGAEKPAILLEATYALWAEGDDKAMEEAGITGEKRDAVENDSKWKLIAEFMEKYGYKQVLRNEKFALYD